MAAKTNIFVLALALLTPSYGGSTKLCSCFVFFAVWANAASWEASLFCLLCHHDLIKRKFWKYSHSTFICSLCGGKRNSSFHNVLLIQRLKTHSLQSILLTWCGRKQKCFLSIFMIIYCVNTLSWLHIHTLYQKTRKLKFKAGFCRISYHCTMSVY